MIVRSGTGRKADPQHSNPLLDSESVLAEYSTLAEFTFGLPRYHVIFTSHRVIIKHKKRCFGLFGKESEHFIGYRWVHSSCTCPRSLESDPICPSAHLLALCGTDPMRPGCRDLVDASVGSAPKRVFYSIVTAIAALGFSLFAVLEHAGRHSSAVALLASFLIISALMLAYDFIMEHIIEGVTLTLDACKCASHRPSAPLCILGTV